MLWNSACNNQAWIFIAGYFEQDARSSDLERRGYIPSILILTEPRPLHCFTCAKKVMLKSVPFCNWIVNYEMAQAVARLHIYLHWDDSCTAVFQLSTRFSLYNSLWLTKWWAIVLFMMTSPNGNIFRVTVTGEFPQKGQRREALMVSLICAWTNRCVTIQTPVIWNAIALIMTSL